MNKYFTVEEANALLPELRVMLGQAKQERQKLLHLSSHLAGAKEGHLFDYGSPAGPAYIEVLDTFYRVAGDIEVLGVVVKDFEQGLCDFPHLRDGEMVYLCWKLDEDSIKWWHEVDAGYQGRQPI
jgi:hypothetical protein